MSKINFTERELSIRDSIASTMSRKWKMYQDKDDMIGELSLWLCENYDKVERYRTEEHGEAKLYTALNRVAAKYAAKETKIKSGGSMEALEYTLPEVKRILPYIWDEIPQTTIYTNPLYENSIIRKVNYSSENSNQLLHIITDIRIAFYSISKEHQKMLELKYRNGYSNVELAKLFDSTEDAIRNKYNRIITNMIKKLNGYSTKWEKNTRISNYIEN